MCYSGYIDPISKLEMLLLRYAKELSFVGRLFALVRRFVNGAQPDSLDLCCRYRPFDLLATERL